MFGGSAFRRADFRHGKGIWNTDLVDAAQSAGILPIDMQDSRIDYLCTAGHKGLYGPMGTGFLLRLMGISFPQLSREAPAQTQFP